MTKALNTGERVLSNHRYAAYGRSVLAYHRVCCMFHVCFGGYTVSPDSLLEFPLEGFACCKRPALYEVMS